MSDDLADTKGQRIVVKLVNISIYTAGCQICPSLVSADRKTQEATLAYYGASTSTIYWKVDACHEYRLITREIYRGTRNIAWL